MNAKGGNPILTSKVKLGADAAPVAGSKEGPLRRMIVMRAEILSYSLSRELLAGISMEASTFRSDWSANKKLYGHQLIAREVVREGKTASRFPGTN